MNATETNRLKLPSPTAPASAHVVLRVSANKTHLVSKFNGKIYETPSGLCTIVWHEPGKPGRQRTTRMGLEAATKFAKAKRDAIATQENWRAKLSESDYAAHLRWIEIAQQCPGVPVEVLLQEAVTARQTNSRANIVPKTCPQIVAELLETKRREAKCGEKWLRNLEKMLNRLADFITGPVELVQPSDLNQWLRGLKGGLVYRHHHYATAIQFFNFAKTIAAVPRESFGADFWKLVEDPDRRPVRIIVWSPKQIEQLLKHTYANMIPFTACGAFAGIRTEELVPEDPRKTPLDWADLDFEKREIHINYETGKTGERIVPMSANLIAWLKPYRKASGPVCELAQPTSALYKAKLRAGLPTAKGESRNVLRKSFGSYRLAQVQNIGQVAEEMGNSPAKIKSNYRKPRSAAEAREWFGILPTNSAIVQQEFSLPGIERDSRRPKSVS
jgi:integrase